MPTTTTTSRPATATLTAVAAAQLVAGGIGQAVALRRTLPYDLQILRMHGRPENVARDSWVLGTALSAPIVMLVAQGGATARLARGTSRGATRVLALLGTAMVGGYLGERLVRERLRPAGWEPLESSTAAAGLGLAATMAVLGWRNWQ